MRDITGETLTCIAGSIIEDLKIAFYDEEGSEVSDSIENYFGNIIKPITYSWNKENSGKKRNES